VRRPASELPLPSARPFGPQSRTPPGVVLGRAHWSAFLDAGARRLGIAGAGTDALAFRNPDGSLVVVLRNTAQQARTLTLALGGAVLELTVPAQGWATLRY
jgi:O-glycosyl hydrolase